MEEKKKRCVARLAKLDVCDVIGSSIMYHDALTGQGKV
jgi:hypothetical protein